MIMCRKNSVSVSCTKCGWKRPTPIRFKSNNKWILHIALWLSSRSYDIHWMKCHMMSEIRTNLGKEK